MNDRRTPGGSRPQRRAPEQVLPAAVSPARAAAFHILQRVMTSAAHSDDLLHTPAVNALSAEDRNLATALVMGVLRWQLQLDNVLRPTLQRPDMELHPAALLSLRMGLFQLLHMDRIPAHAALNESVELARANGAAHAAGMVNAILRRAVREKDAPKRQTLAVARTPEEEAHPEWLLRRWRANFGAAAARLISTYDQAEPPSHSLFEDDPALPRMDDGSRLVAEIAAASVSQPQRILDCCAAPGGKTAVLVVRHPQAEILACDVSQKRLDAMRVRMDADAATKRVKTRFVDMTKPNPDLGTFDLILCDAPCSGTGTLARNPEIRHRLRESDLARQAERQIAILTQAAALLAPGGRMVYSTCSLEPEENAAVVAAVPGLRTVSVAEVLPSLRGLWQGALENTVDGAALRTLPGQTACDGFYAVILTRDA